MYLKLPIMVSKARPVCQQIIDEIRVSLTFQILTNDVQVLILCLSYFITTVPERIHDTFLVMSVFITHSSSSAGVCCGPCNPSKWEDDI